MRELLNDQFFIVVLFFGIGYGGTFLVMEVRRWWRERQAEKKAAAERWAKFAPIAKFALQELKLQLSEIRKFDELRELPPAGPITIRRPNRYVAQKELAQSKEAQ